MPISESDIDPLALEIVEEVTPDIRSKSGVWENEDLAQVCISIHLGSCSTSTSSFGDRLLPPPPPRLGLWAAGIRVAAQ